MMERATQGTTAPTPRYRPTPLEAMTPALRRMVVIGEDSRFWTHHGIDFAELEDALGLDRASGIGAVRQVWERRARLRGASTISQQLAKNLYLSPSRSLLRKLKEAVTAVRLEGALGKSRILELYLNLAEWGGGTWGAEEASRRYFGREASELDDSAAAALVAALPSPRRANPARPSPGWALRRTLILERYTGVPVSLPAEDSEADTAAPRVGLDSTLDTGAITPLPAEAPAAIPQDSVDTGRPPGRDTESLPPP